MTSPTFQEGDEVVLACGTYPGTLGVFLHLKEDVNWADIRERTGDIRSHPVIWLAHPASAALGSKN
jgi:dTDP-4-amino-4,6-dideoxygalactose transaminase